MTIPTIEKTTAQLLESASDDSKEKISEGYFGRLQLEGLVK